MISRSVKEQIQYARDLRDAGDLADARDALLAVVPKGPDSAALFTALGDIYWDLGELDLAVESFRKASSLAPKFELASRGLFHCLLEHGRGQEALDEMRRFVSVADSKDYQVIMNALQDEEGE